MSYLCPKGHQSVDDDYCSECGAPIRATKVKAMNTDESIVISNITEVNEICPECGTERTPGCRFCEVCRHDFNEKKIDKVISEKTQINEIKENNVIDKKKIEVEKIQVKNTVNELITNELKFNIILSIDSSKVDDDPELRSSCPRDSKDRIYHIDLEENLVGRRSEGKSIYPEIEISDPGVSHRHLKIMKNNAGYLEVLELGSANGTELNGKELEPGVITRLNIGDELFIGLWTKLKVVERR